MGIAKDGRVVLNLVVRASRRRFQSAESAADRIDIGEATAGRTSDWTWTAHDPAAGKPCCRCCDMGNAPLLDSNSCTVSGNVWLDVVKRRLKPAPRARSVGLGLAFKPVIERCLGSVGWKNRRVLEERHESRFALPQTFV